VRTAYWRALAAEYLSRELPKVEARAREALEQSRVLIKDGNISPLTALAYQKEIYEIQDRVQTVQTEVVSARAQLASLMNLPPGTNFTLVRPKAEPAARALPDAKRMMASALEYRPELREALYQERITGRDQLIAILETLPTAGLFANANTTSNSFAQNKEWLGYGAQASWNLMRVFTLPVRQAEAAAKENLAQERARALVSTMALQVAISRDRYQQARRRLQTASDFQNVQKELLEQLKASTSAARSGEQELVREELSSLLARARYDVALAEVQGAWAIVQTTMGRDPYPDLVSNDLNDMKAAFRAKLSGRPMPARVVSNE
jgi:outer membrane protein TolC